MPAALALAALTAKAEHTPIIRTASGAGETLVREPASATTSRLPLGRNARTAQGGHAESRSTATVPAPMSPGHRGDRQQRLHRRGGSSHDLPTLVVSVVGRTPALRWSTTISDDWCLFRQAGFFQ